MNLATKLRPKSIDKIIGQSHLLGEGKILRRMVDSNTLSSMILYAPPGVGKTSIAAALSGSMGIPFVMFNATKDDKKKLQEFAKMVEETNEPLIIALDEIHRLDKPKQEFLLSFMEEGLFIVIGTTTENPYISVTPAIRSRSHIFELKPLSQDELKELTRRGCMQLMNEGYKPLRVDETAINLLTSRINGDGRSLLNTLELAVKSTPEREVTVEIMEECLQQKSSFGDKDGDSHYNLLSAFQKSIRGSDVDASIHYLAKLIESGDLVSICRRLSIIAYEDIGLADIHSVNSAILAINTAREVGFPEAKIPLAYAVTTLALSTKSNLAYAAIKQALDVVKTTPTSIPNHLKDTHFKGAEKLGHVGYKYPHDYNHHYVTQQYMPDEIKDHSYFNFSNVSKMEKETLEPIYNYVQKDKERL